jgi:hypothetical protein
MNYQSSTIERSRREMKTIRNVLQTRRLDEQNAKDERMKGDKSKKSLTDRNLLEKIAWPTAM